MVPQGRVISATINYNHDAHASSHNPSGSVFIAFMCSAKKLLVAPRTRIEGTSLYG
jgi:hypothetical protein